MADEHAALEILELRERVADLEADVATLRETLRASVELNHELHTQNRRLRTCLQRQLWDVFGFDDGDRQAAA